MTVGRDVVRHEFLATVLMRCQVFTVPEHLNCRMETFLLEKRILEVVNFDLMCIARPDRLWGPPNFL